MYLVNTATEVDVCIGDEMISEGHADPAVVGSAIAVNDSYGLAPLGPGGDSDSEPEPDPAPVPRPDPDPARAPRRDSEPSESASQVAGDAPSISPWAGDSDDDGSVVTHTTGTSTFSSIILQHKLNALRAADLGRLRAATRDDDSVVTATDAASTVLAGGSSLSSRATPVPHAATPASSPMIRAKLRAHRLCAARSPDDSHARTEPNALSNDLSALSVLASKSRALRASAAPGDSSCVTSCVSSASVTLQRILALHKKNAQNISRG